MYERMIDDMDINAGTVLTGKTVQELVRIYHFQRNDEAAIRRVLKNGAIAREWRCEYDESVWYDSKRR